MAFSSGLVGSRLKLIFDGLKIMIQDIGGGVSISNDIKQGGTICKKSDLRYQIGG